VRGGRGPRRCAAGAAALPSPGHQASLAAYNAFFTDEESGSYTHHLDVGLKIDVTGDLNANVSWVWDYVQDPRAVADGSFPQKDDTRLIFGLGWSF
jgi:hypothetical protein